MNSATAIYNLGTPSVNLKVTIEATPQPGWDTEQGEVAKTEWFNCHKAIAILLHEIEHAHGVLSELIEEEIASAKEDEDEDTDEE